MVALNPDNMSLIKSILWNFILLSNDYSFMLSQGLFTPVSTLAVGCQEDICFCKQAYLLFRTA
jgi:hypothetical protein